MLCKKYSDLSIPERVVVVGEAIHALQNDSECYTAIMDIVKDAKIKGVFAGVNFSDMPYLPDKETLIKEQ